MNALIVAFTLFTAPVNVADNGPITLQPTTTIEFTAIGTSASAQKKPWTQCNRFVKAAQAAGMLGYCTSNTGATEYVAPVKSDAAAE